MILVALIALGFAVHGYWGRLGRLREHYKNEVSNAEFQAEVARTRAELAKGLLPYWVKQIETARQEESAWAAKLAESRRKPTDPKHKPGDYAYSKDQQDDFAQVLDIVQKRIRSYEANHQQVQRQFDGYTARRTYFQARRKRYERVARYPWLSAPIDPPEPPEPQ